MARLREPCPPTSLFGSLSPTHHLRPAPRHPENPPKPQTPQMKLNTEIFLPFFESATTMLISSFMVMIFFPPPKPVFLHVRGHAHTCMHAHLHTCTQKPPSPNPTHPSGILEVENAEKSPRRRAHSPRPQSVVPLRCSPTHGASFISHSALVGYRFHIMRGLFQGSDCLLVPWLRSRHLTGVQYMFVKSVSFTGLLPLCLYS